MSVRVVPQPTPLDQVPVDALGWLAPDGRFFACAFTMHDDLARLLTGAEYGDARDGTQVLERHGWLRVVYGGYVGRASGALRCTQAQLDTLFELSQSARMTDLYRTNVWHMVQLYEVM